MCPGLPIPTDGLKTAENLKSCGRLDDAFVGYETARCSRINPPVLHLGFDTTDGQRAPVSADRRSLQAALSPQCPTALMLQTSLLRFRKRWSSVLVNWLPRSECRICHPGVARSPFPPLGSPSADPDGDAPTNRPPACCTDRAPRKETACPPMWRSPLYP